MIRIPVIRDARGRVRPSFKITLPLGGITYDLGFHWNGRAATWVCDIALTGLGMVASGLAVRSGEFIGAFGREGLPPGHLFVADRLNKKIDPGRDDLGDRVRIYFFNAEELAA